MAVLQPAQRVPYAIQTHTVDTMPLITVKYIGSGAGTAQVVVASNKIVFQAAGANDATIQLGDSAAAGEIVYGGTASPTYKQIVDHLNESQNWKACLGVALPGEIPHQSADPFLNDATAVDAKVKGGIALEHDTSQAISSTNVFAAGLKIGRWDVEGNDDASIINYIEFMSESDASTPNLRVYAVDMNALTSRLIYSAGIASPAVIDTDAEFYGAGNTRQGKVGEYLVARLEEATAITTPTLTVLGSFMVGGANKLPAFFKSSM